MRNRVAPVVCWIAILGLLLVGATKLSNARQTSEVANAGPQRTIEYVEWEQSAPPSWLKFVADDAELDAVREKLAMPIKLRCENKPLNQALKLVEAQVGTKVAIDEMEFSLIGIDAASPVTVEVSGNLMEVLDFTLAAVENADNNLTWRISPFGIQITSKENADAEPELRTFDLTYFLPDASHADQLMMLVMQHVDPDSWLLAGGSNVISHFGSQLVVSAPSSTMLRIEKLLVKVSKQDREHLKAPKFKEVEAATKSQSTAAVQRDSK